MKSHSKFWTGSKLELSAKCANRNLVLVNDVHSEMFFVVKKYADGSYLHTKETELFKSRHLSEINAFIDTVTK